MMTFDVNNNGVMTITQVLHDGNVAVCTDRPNEPGTPTVISAGDMVMLINYYKYQKEHNEPIF